MPELRRFQNVVAGREESAASGRWIASAYPSTGKDRAEVPHCGQDEATAVVEAAHAAFTVGTWPALPATATARGKLLRHLGDLIARDADPLAAIEVLYNGKLLAEMGGQLRYIPEWFDYFGGLADKVEGSVLPTDKSAIFTYTRCGPVGVVVAITPWTSPLLLLTWKLGPALAAGCTVVIKPSEYTACSTIALMPLLEEAGFPPRVVNTVTGYGGEIGEALVTHSLVSKVACTGSNATGAAVYVAAAPSIKPVTLELGGKSPNVVFADAKLDCAVKGAISGIRAASGQTCIAGSRLLVQRPVYDQVCEGVAAMARVARLGDPMELSTQVGPITTQAQREKVFGPVLSIIPFDDDDDDDDDDAEAVAIANDTPYGLAAGVRTQNIRRAVTMAERLRAGAVWVNTYRAVSFVAPFGGCKQSGIGRASGQEAIDENLRTNCVWISLAETMANPSVLR